METLKKLTKNIETLSLFTGYFSAVFVILMVLVVFYDVMMRYFFNSGSIAMQELEWHFFAAVFLLGMAYTLKEDGHVRVDVFYDRMTEKEKAWVNVLGAIFFILPFCFVIAYSSWDFVSYSFAIQEHSPDPGGLPYRFLLKSLIPLSFLFLFLQSFAFVGKNLEFLIDDA